MGREGYIGRQSVVTVVYLAYGALIVDTEKGKSKL